MVIVDLLNGIGMNKMKIEIDKIAHFVAGIIGWTYFRYIFAGGLSEGWSHLIVFILGGLWEFYWWKIKRKDKFDFIDWGFVVLGAVAIHFIALNSWIFSPLGYLACLFIYLMLRKIWW